MEGLDGDKEVESVMITTTPPSKDVRSPKRKRGRGEIGQSFSGCGLGEKLERDGPHGSGTMENSSLQE